VDVHKMLNRNDVDLNFEEVKAYEGSSAK